MKTNTFRDVFVCVKNDSYRIFIWFDDENVAVALGEFDCFSALF